MIPNNFPYMNHYEAPEPILRDVFDKWALGKGIFSAMESLENVVLPWSDDSFVDSNILDIEYFGNVSGSRFCSPVVKHLLDDSGVLSDDSRSILAKILITKYIVNWQHLWDVNMAVYDPLNNYSMTETRSRMVGESETQRTVNTMSKTGTLATEYDTVDSTEHGRTVTDTEYRFGYDSESEDRDPYDIVESEEGGTTDETKTGTDTITRNMTDTDTGSKDSARGLSEEEVVNRSGKMGDVSQQKIIEDERKLWTWNYFARIFADIDSELGLMFYDPCRV